MGWGASLLLIFGQDRHNIGIQNGLFVGLAFHFQVGFDLIPSQTWVSKQFWVKRKFEEPYLSFQGSTGVDSRRPCHWHDLWTPGFFRETGPFSLVWNPDRVMYSSLSRRRTVKVWVDGAMMMVQWRWRDDNEATLLHHCYHHCYHVIPSHCHVVAPSTKTRRCDDALVNYVALSGILSPELGSTDKTAKKEVPCYSICGTIKPPPPPPPPISISLSFTGNYDVLNEIYSSVKLNNM